MSMQQQQVKGPVPWFDAILTIGHAYMMACQHEGIQPDAYLVGSFAAAGLEMITSGFGTVTPTAVPAEAEARSRVYDRVMCVADDLGTEMLDEQQAYLAAWAGRLQ